MSLRVRLRDITRTPANNQGQTDPSRGWALVLPPVHVLRATTPLPMLKNLLDAGVVRALAVRCLRGYLGFALRTTHWEMDIHPDAAFWLRPDAATGVIAAFWHESLAVVPQLRWWASTYNNALRVNVMISRNRDGKIISDIVAPWDVNTIAGSSARRGKNKGAATALRQSIAALAKGELLAITPDGPKGPRHEVQPGAVMLARHTKAPILPIGASCRCVRMKSWDRMMIPLPWGKGKITCGAPILPHDRLDADAIAAAINNATIQSSIPTNSGTSAAWHLWRALGQVATPALAFLVRRRLRRGKEATGRTRERMGFATLQRPHGRVIWIHAASVGESLSILPVIEDIVSKFPTPPYVLLTTATLTASDVVERARQKLGNRLLHQFVPFDVTHWINRFLDHWQPDTAVLVESELWPAMIDTCHQRRIHLALVNARMSASSFRQWQKIPRFSEQLFSKFSWIAARTGEDAQRLRALGALRVEETGDLKEAAPPLHADEAELSTLKARLNGRPIWLAASTHDGEESVILDAVDTLRHKIPDLLTIIVPRHPNRGAEIARVAGQAPRRSLNEFPQPHDAVWVCDTLAELGIFYRLATICFLGNSLPGDGKRGGHNPYEPARLHCVISTGPETANFSEAFDALAGVITRVETPQELADFVYFNLKQDPAACAQLADDGFQIATIKSGITHYFATRLLSLSSS